MNGPQAARDRLPQKTVIIPESLHGRLGRRQQHYRDTYGEQWPFWRIIDEALDALDQEDERNA